MNDDCVASSPLSVSGSLSICESIVSLPLDDDVYVVSMDTLVDPIDDRIDSSCKINLSLRIVEANVMNENTSSIDSFPIVDDVNIVRVDTLVDPINDQIESSCKINLCPPSIEDIMLNERASSYETCIDKLVCENCPPLEVMCVVINRTQVSEEFYNVGQQNGSKPKSYSRNNLVLEIALKLDIDLLDIEELTCFKSAHWLNYALLRNNVFFGDDIDTPNKPSGEKDGIAYFRDYSLYANPL